MRSLVPTARASSALLALVALALTATVRDAVAQRHGSGTGQRVDVRAELAAVLLQSGRYEEAAREYRALLARDRDNRSHRLNLARALAWGNHPREAEPILRALANHRPVSTDVIGLLRSARDDMEPRSSEAAEWVTEDPDWPPYRVALARALARDGHPLLAAEQYRMLLRVPGGSGVPPSATLREEITDALVAAGDLRSALAYQDSILATSPTAALYAERARLHFALGDRAAGRADVATSVRLGPSVEGYLLLGELHYEDGEWAPARQAWTAARALGPEGARVVTPALARVAREERPAVALIPTVGSDPGWEATLEGAADDLGVGLARIGGRRAAAAGDFVLEAGGEYRILSEHGAAGSTTSAGVAASAGISSQLARGRHLLRVGARGGVVRHHDVPAIGEGEARLALWRDAWQVEVGVVREAAYPRLFTIASLRPPGGGAPLVSRSVTAAAAGPAGGADLAASVERTRLSDGNRRTTLQLYARHALAPGVYGIYAASSDAFAERSTDYWDPIRYVAHAVGLELAERSGRGISWALRFLPSLASAHEQVARVTLGGPFGEDSLIERESVRSRGLQLEAAGDLSYRIRGWETAATVGYSRGRAGGYRRIGATFVVRRVP